MDREGLKTMAIKQAVKYVAVVGIDFEQFKPPIRIEANEPIPARVDVGDLADLLAQGLIKKAESEGVKNE